MSIKEKLGRQLLFFDGAMGSMLQTHGLQAGQLPETLNITHKDTVSAIHKAYLDVGVDVITTNTFGAYSTKYANLEEVIKCAIVNAKEAIKQAGGKERYIALDLGPSGHLLKPLGDLEFGDAYEIFKESAMLGEKYGADLAIIETMSDTYETKAAILAVKENTSLPIIATMTFDESEKTLTGGSPHVMVSLLEGLGVDALGINCGLGPKQIKNIFEQVAQYASIPILLQPNAGLPRIVNGKTMYDVTEDGFAQLMHEMCKSGAWLLGGCCGTTPKHIEKMIDLCNDVTPPAIVDKQLTVISSYSKAVTIGLRPIVIGERINPTGKKKFKEALKRGDMEYIVNEALAQIDCGADVLDINVGLPEIDEKEFMVKAVKAVQAVTNIPLQIDSGSPDVIEAALRVYNGKALVNSVNGKNEIMESIFPIVKKYGGVIVGLALDENGIPEKADGRLKVAEKIVATAEKYGISRKDIIIDTLTLTASAQQKDCLETVKALKLVRDKLGLNTILGVSNISFGLPAREVMNASFFAIALHNGLTACIINPLSEAMMNVVNCYNVLAGFDDGCGKYIEKYKTETSVKNEKPSDNSIKDFIIKGLKERTFSATVDELTRTEPLDIINNEIVPALDYVGAKYEKGHFFLPQLIMSAEAAKQSFEAINKKMKASGVAAALGSAIILATVHGDIHDIGKNIVKALLENYGYNVVDLGKDVPISRVIEAVKENNAKLVGLSALMTTTVPNMEKTIAQLRKECPDCKVMVGGAVLNEDYAKMIDADYYCKDALSAVNLLKRIGFV